MIDCTQTDDSCRSIPCCSDDPSEAFDYVAVTPINCVEIPIVTILPEGGTTQTFPLEITITSSRADATIYYTLDGTAPTQDSNLYLGPFTINDPAVIIVAMAVVEECGPPGSAFAWGEEGTGNVWGYGGYTWGTE